jgi:acyl-homoserine lactone acylase PvdQ
MGFYRHSQPYEHTVGASLRIIIDAGHLENSGYILAAGQSGHPTSHHFRDQNKLWQQHLYIQFLDTEQTTSNQPSLSLMPLLKRN